MGLTALLPPGVLVALVLTSSCSAVASLRFLGLISPALLPSARFELSSRGIELERLFEVVATRVDEDDGIMMVSCSGSGSCPVCLH